MAASAEQVQKPFEGQQVPFMMPMMPYGMPYYYGAHPAAEQPKVECKCEKCKCETVEKEMKAMVGKELTKLQQQWFAQQKAAWLAYDMEQQKQLNKFKRLIQGPNAEMISIMCSCNTLVETYSHATSVVKCTHCGKDLLIPSAGKAKTTKAVAKSRPLTE